MKNLGLFLLLSICCFGAVFAADVPVSELLKDALFAEEADRDLVEAEKGYREILRRFDSERVYAATATLRLGEVLLARGETAEAERLFARVLEEFGDQEAVAKVAAVRLGDKAARVGEAADSKLNRLEKMLAESPDLLNAEVDGATPLDRAAEEGEADVVRYLIAKGANLEGERGPYVDYTRGKIMVTPLAKAAAGGHLEVVELLIDAGAKLDPGLLHVAVEAGYLAVAKKLVDSGMDLDVRFPCEVLINGITEQSRVVPAGRGRARDGAAPSEPKSNPKWYFTALEVAAYQGFGEVARYLVESGADVGGWQGKPSKALYSAIEKGDEMLVDLLLANGADPNGVGRGIGSPRGAPPLRLASSRGFGGIVKRLLDAGADIAPKPEHGWTPLHHAVGDTAQILIDAGADVNALSVDGVVPLANLSRDESGIDKAKALLAAGADPNLMSEEGNPPLVMAVMGGSPEVVKVLLDGGADVSIGGSYGTPLALAAYSAEMEIIDRILKDGGDPNQADVRGWTALHYAVANGKAAAVATLLEGGANPEGVGGDSPAPITVLGYGDKVRKEDKESESEQFAEKVRLLVEAGADIEIVAPVESPRATTSVVSSRSRMVLKQSGGAMKRKPTSGMGETILFKAARRGNAEVVDYLLSKGARSRVGEVDVYEVVEDNDALRTQLFRAVQLDSEHRAGVLRVGLSDAAKILQEAIPVGDEECPYSVFEAFGFSNRTTTLSTGEALIWREGSDEPITANLKELADAADPAGDIPLQWGDYVEFRTPKDDLDSTLSDAGLSFLFKHLKRGASIKVVDGKGKTTWERKVSFSMATRSGVGDGSRSRPGKSSKGTYYIKPTTASVGYLVPLLDLAGQLEDGRKVTPNVWRLLRRGPEGGEMLAEFDTGGSSPWLEDGDEVVLQGRVTRTATPASKVRTRPNVLPQKSR